MLRGYPAISETLEGYGKTPYSTSGHGISTACGRKQFLPESQKPQVYHKAINPDIKSHTRLLW
ncbi:hypothetical protein ACTQ34_09675, partial [Agathobaculum sp. LCP25S3_E8]|uniref:hypothetical protein n=1 Tax=Agathobaculum sp. LCP25S3_E8 TaxID=3438735 RepID=UPI003F8F3147